MFMPKTYEKNNIKKHLQFHHPLSLEQISPVILRDLREARLRTPH